MSVPLSVLDPPHQYRIHRRKSFDASDTLALPRVSSYMGPGWGRTWGCPLCGPGPQIDPEAQRGSGTVPRLHSEAGLKEGEALEFSLGHCHHCAVLAPRGRWGTPLAPRLPG